MAEPAVFCSAERVLELYNQDPDTEERQKMCGAVKSWFEKEAAAAGWLRIRFIPEYGSNYGAGCVMLAPTGINVEVTQNTIVLPEPK